MIKSVKIWKVKALWRIALVTVALVMMVVTSLAFMISGAAAQDHYNHMAWNNGIAYLAEKQIREAEIRRAEQRANEMNAKSETEVAVPADVATADNEKDSSNCQIVMVNEDTKC